MDFDYEFKDGMGVVSYKYKHDMGKVGVELEIDIIELLKKAAADSANTVDDRLVALVEAALK